MRTRGAPDPVPTGGPAPAQVPRTPASTGGPAPAQVPRTPASTGGPAPAQVPRTPAAWANAHPLVADGLLGVLVAVVSVIALVVQTRAEDVHWPGAFAVVLIVAGG